MENNAKIARQLRAECGISANQLRSLVNNLSEKGIDVSAVQRADLQVHVAMLSEMWKTWIDGRHSEQMHRYILFALSENYRPSGDSEKAVDESGILLPFSRQKIYISRALAFEFILLNGKLVPSLSSKSDAVPIMQPSQMKLFLKDYLSYIWATLPSRPPCADELLSLAGVSEEPVLQCWHETPEPVWLSLLDAISASSAVTVLMLLCRLAGGSGVEVEDESLPGLSLIRRLYADDLQAEGRSADAWREGWDLPAVWARLAGKAGAEEWSRRLSDGAAVVPVDLARRDLLLAWTVRAGPGCGAGAVAPLRDGVESYLRARYGGREQVLAAHADAVERRAREETEETNDFIRWLLQDVSPHVLISNKTLIDAILRRVGAVMSLGLFQHLIKTWPAGEHCKVLLRRAFASLSDDDKVFLLKNPSGFAFPDGPQGWAADLRRCLNRVSKSEISTTIEELHFLVLYDAEGVLCAIAESAITNKGSFDLMVSLLDALSYTFALPHNARNDKDHTCCLLSSVLRPLLHRAWTGQLSADQSSGWSHLCQHLLARPPSAPDLPLRLLRELVVSSLDTRRPAGPVLRLAAAVVAGVDPAAMQESLAAEDLRCLFAFAVSRLSLRRRAAPDAEEAPEEEDEEDAAAAVVAAMQDADFPPMLAADAALLQFLASRASLGQRLFCRRLFAAARRPLELSVAALGRCVRREELEKKGIVLREAAEAGEGGGEAAKAAANFLLLATSSAEAAELLVPAASPRWAGDEDGEEPVAVLASALVHVAARLSRAAWRRVPEVMAALMTLVRHRVACRLLSGAAVAPWRLNDAVVDLAVLNILYVVCEVLLISSRTPTPVARSCAEAARSFLADIARRGSADAASPPALSFLCREGAEWARELSRLCPDAWAQTEGLRLVRNEFNSLLAAGDEG